MTTTPCSAPLAFADVVDYWAGELTRAEADRIEEHVFVCDACARELADGEVLARSIGAVARDGRLQSVVTEAILNRLAADGVRIRMFTLEGSGIVPCAVWAGDDLIVSRIRADFADAESVTIVTRLPSGEEVARLADIPVRPGQREILNTYSAAHLRQLPATRVSVSVIARIGSDEQMLAEYTLEHGGSFERRSGGR
jgi:Putative zinc-finger